jgi:hypothetical protein
MVYVTGTLPHPFVARERSKKAPKYPKQMMPKPTK